MSLCSVVMVTYQTGAVLLHAIERVLKQVGLAELILVDNGNPPDVLAKLRDITNRHPRATLLSGHGNVGFSKGCNLGARYATGEFILLLNPDCLLPDGALEQTMIALSTTPGAMLAGCQLLNADGTQQRGSRRALLTPVSAMSESLGLHRFLRVKRLNYHHTAMPEHTHKVPAISGAFMCMKRHEFLQLGGMDEGYFLHVEDLDLCWRVTQAGGSIIMVPQVQVVHLLSTSKVGSVFIEWCKAKGFIRYFNLHFKKTSPGFSALAGAGILLRFALKSLRIALRRNAPFDASALIGRKTLMLLGNIQTPPLADMKGKVVAVTGATSPVGLLCIGRLLAAGARVIAISRQPGLPAIHPMLSWMRQDIGAYGFTPPMQAQILIHCAPLWTLTPALETFVSHGVQRVVAFGSTSVFAKQSSPNADEQAVVAHLREAEAFLHTKSAALGVACTILRPTMIYGAGLDQNIARIARFIERYGVCPIYPPADGLRAPVHADDLAQAAIRVLSAQQTEGKSYNLSGGETLTYRAMVERIFSTLHRRPRFIALPFLPRLLDLAGILMRRHHVNGAMALRMNEHLDFPHNDAASDFGYAPQRFLADGLRDVKGLT